jgi:hypothetical protein
MQTLLAEAQLLANLLVNSDASSIRTLAAIEALVGGTTHAAAFKAIATAARNYDFDAALRDLQAWAARTGSDLRV